MKTYDYQGRFLEAWEPLRRGVVGNRFYNAVRDGASTIDDVIDIVGTDAQQFSQLYGDAGNEGSDGRILLTLIDSELMREFAEHVLWRESLTPEERGKLKTESKVGYRTSWMKNKPPTPKQLKYLEGLACHVIPANMQESSDLIEKYKSGNAV